MQRPRQDAIPNTVRLLAVSKTFPPEAIRAVHALGQRRSARTTSRSAPQKIDALADLTDIEWHLIGPLQSNKTAIAARRFGWVQTIDRMKIAERLARERAPDAPPLESACRSTRVARRRRAASALRKLSAREGRRGASEAANCAAHGHSRADRRRRRRRAQFRVLRECLDACAPPG
jgi:hypothetical protein